MTDYKGRQSARAIEQNFPHLVDTVVPPGGLGARLNAMYDFHARHGIQAKRGQRHRGENGGGVIRWCFADPEIAAAFASEFDAK